MASEQPCLANSLNCFNKDFYYLGEQQADIQSDIYLCVEAQSSNVNGEFGVDSGPPRRLHSFLSCRKLVTVIAAAAFQLLPICFISSASLPRLLVSLIVYFWIASLQVGLGPRQIISFSRLGKIIKWLFFFCLNCTCIVTSCEGLRIANANI